jgi:PAS domain S-box-containing protein
MAINDEVFYLYGTLDSQGFLTELKGQGIADIDFSLNASGSARLTLADLGKGYSLHAVDNSSIKEAVEKAAAGRTVSINAELVAPGAASPGGDKPRRLKLTLMPVTGNASVAREISFAALDVTDYLEEIKFYKDRSEQLFFAAETAGIGLFFWHLNKDDIFTTPRFNELYGLASDEVMTREKFARVIHPEDMKLVNDTILKSHNDFGECNTEYRVILDGKIRWIWIRGRTFPGTENSPAFTMGSGRDITEWKDSDQAVTKLLRSEQQARDEVEQANRAKDHFIAMVSHELRAPLNSILGWVKILLTKAVDEETRMNALETIERSARVQAKLIGDLVDSSKIISGKLSLEFHPVNLPDVLSYVVESQKPAAQAKNIRLSYSDGDGTIKVKADLGRLQQIFTNLLANAVKFTPDGGKIAVGMEKNGDDVRISVEDTGKGIGAEELPHIFESYFQGRIGESTDKSGLGLGLSIVSSLVRQHGGTIVAESRGAGYGAKFVVTLPVLAAADDIDEPRDEDGRPELSEEPLEKLRILLVEDNDDSREVLQIFFEQRGAEVAAMSSVAEAMKDIHSNKNLPDVIVSDISMPDEDGYSLIRKIRSLPAKKGGNIPAIALTALVSRDDATNLLASGFQFHHPKPFESERLIKEILEAVK